MKEFVYSFVLGLVFLVTGCVTTNSSVTQKEEQQCSSKPTTEEAVADVLNRTGPGTQSWNASQDQAAMDRLKDTFNAMPPHSYHVKEVDELIIFAVPNTESAIYILSFKGCAVALGVSDQASLVHILGPQGISL